MEGGVEPGGGIPEPGVCPGMKTCSREGGEGTRELHGIEEGVGGCGGLLVRHLQGSDHHHHHHSVTDSVWRVLCSQLVTVYLALLSPPVPVLLTNTKYQHQDSQDVSSEHSL